MILQEAGVEYQARNQTFSRGVRAASADGEGSMEGYPSPAD